MKPIIQIESLGYAVRLHLVNHSTINDNLFANLAWVCSSDDGRVFNPENDFVCSREKLTEAIKAFRYANITQPRRGKGLVKQSPFEFHEVSQFNAQNKVLTMEGYKQGEYQDVQENPWQDYKPSVEKHFEKVA
jgi:hypothetical protein